MALSNAAVLTAYSWFQRETNAHADEFYDYGAYNYYKEFYGSESYIEYFYSEYSQQSDANLHSSMDKIILSGILIATSFFLDIFWIFVLRPKI